MQGAPLVTVPGIYDDIPIEAYHGREICPGHSVSKTGIKDLLDCPLVYWSSSYLNPDRAPPRTDPLRFGAAIHMALTHPVDFAAKVKSWPRFIAKNEMERAAHEARGGIVLRDSELQPINDMIFALRQDKAAMELLSHPGYVEQTIAWKDEETGIWLRTRPDFRAANERYVMDYKTAASADPATAWRQVFNLYYHVQAAMLSDGLHATTGRRPRSVIYLFQSKTAPYPTSMINISESAMQVGRMLIKKALRRLRKCLDDGHFPSYTPNGPISLEMPGWVEYQLKDDDEIDATDGARQEDRHG